MPMKFEVGQKLQFKVDYFHTQ